MERVVLGAVSVQNPGIIIRQTHMFTRDAQDCAARLETVGLMTTAGHETCHCVPNAVPSHDPVFMTLPTVPSLPPTKDLVNRPGSSSSPGSVLVNVSRHAIPDTPEDPRAVCACPISRDAGFPAQIPGRPLQCLVFTRLQLALIRHKYR